ncbi:MAG: S41 family peptidase [Bacteroides sp.]|nr:S41 family peptidase [Ruminococcus flavefaciens]MCM1554349.1 S41 family peptidase [Bacteroides sp.]
MKKRMFGIALLLAAGAFAYAQNAREEALWFTYPAISPDGKTVAFSHQGDIFTVPVSGGEARQLTSNPSYEAYPVWSPDGTKIAFASDREGSLDLYYVPVQGGAPVRLTTNSGAEIPLSFTDRGTVLYRASEMEAVQSLLFPGDYPQVYEVDLQGGRPQLFSAYPYIKLSLNPDGSLLYEDKKGYEDNWRKHHTSSVTRDIWLVKDGRHTRLTTFKGEDMDPVWAPDYRNFYYLSEENGSFNVYRKRLSPESASEQLTRFSTHPVRFLSVAKDGTLCFTYNGSIYTMQPGKEAVKLAVRIVTDNSVAKVTKKIMRSGATEIAVSPKKNEVAFVLGGDVYVTSVDYATTKRITNTPETERTVDFAPDGRSIVYASERDGVWQLYQASLEDKNDKNFTYAGKIKEEQLAKSDETSFQPKYSPDGKEVAFLRNRTEICVLNLKSGKVRTVMDGKYEYSYTDGDQDFCWSPDGKWILTGYIGTGGWNHKDLALVKADGSGEIHNLTNSGYSEGNGKFVLGGKAMLFESDRSGYRSHGSWGAEGDAYIMFFDKQAFEDFLKNKEERALAEERAKDAKKEDKKEDKKSDKDSADAKKKVEDLKFDFDYLEDRTLRLTSSSDMLGDIALSPKGDKLYYLAPHNGKIALWEKDLVEQKTELKIPGIGYGQFHMTDDGEIFLLAGGGIKKVKAGAGSADNIEYEALYENRPFEQRAYLFSHIWRQVKDKFYDPTFRGMDWKAYFDNYERFLPYINNGYDFSIMVSELLGELNASHTGCRFYSGGAMQTAALGVFIDPAYEGDGLRIQEVLHNSPFALCGKDIKPGDVITHIDGQQIKAGEDYFPLLEGRAGKATRFGIAPAKGKAFEVVVKPIAKWRQNALLYERWVKRNERMVDSLSGGRLAYVHIQGMDSRSFRTIYRQLLNDRNRNREAVIVDTRNNGGGWLHDDVATLLSGKRYARFSPRGQFVSDEPFGKWTKPSCMLVSENNYSDAHGTPYTYKQLKIGKLIGAPVPGTMTAVWWESLPGGYVFGIPQVGALDENGNYLENQDLIPDIIIYNTPETIMEGRDLQIEKAVEEMLKEADALKK